MTNSGFERLTRSLSSGDLDAEAFFREVEVRVDASLPCSPAVPGNVLRLVATDPQ